MPQANSAERRRRRSLKGLVVPVAIKRGIPRQIAKELDVIKTRQSGLSR
jgi:hypothetical protein